MKAMYKMKMTGANDRMKMLTFMVLSAVLAMAWVFVNVGNQVEIDQKRFADASEQMVLSQSLAKYTLAATTGDTDAFAKLETSRDLFTAIIDRQMADFGEASGKTDTPEFHALIDLDNSWRGFRYNINEVLEGQSLILAIAEATSLMSEAMPQMMEHTQDIVDTLVKNGASANQVRLASQQAVLGQRIVNSLNGVMSGERVESAAVSFGKDTREFGRVLDGFMRGTGGIKVLQGKSLQSKIQKIALLFSRVSDNVGSIVENSEELVAIQAAATAITGQSETLFDAAKQPVLQSFQRNGQYWNLFSLHSLAETPQFLQAAV